MSNSDITRRIEMRIKELGLSKADFYKGSGITSASFSQWNSGIYEPSKKKLQSAADFLGVTLEYLETGAEKNQPTAGEADRLILEKMDLLTSDEQAAVLQLIDSIISGRSGG